MNLPDFLRSSYRRSRPSVRRRFRRPALEQLEDRTMLATFAVNSSLDFWIDPDTGGRRYYVDNDPGNGSVGIDDHPGLITLRAAIQESNALAGKDTINIDFSVGVIQPGKKLEPIIDSVVITTVPASATRVVLDGSLAGVSGALDIFSNDSVVSRLVIQNFEEGGIGLWGGLRNTIQDNYIGTDVTGTSATGGNTAFGIGIDGSNHNIIGGIGPGQGNIISNNDGYGIHIRGAATHANIVQGNRIGTDTTGALDRGNTRDGIFIEGAFENTIGGIEIGAGNVISNSHAHGIHIQGAGAHGNIVQGNRIGTDMGGTANLGNFRHGVFIERASNNTIGGIDDGAGNVIAFNGRDLGINGHGVVVAVIPADPAPPSTPEVPATGNSIRRNSIFSNAGRGIDLGNDSFTVNGFGEDTTGPNHFQDYPVVTKVVDVGGGIREITWTLNTTAVAGRRYAIEFFANTEPDPSGFGEAEEYLLTREMITDVDGNATLDPPLRTARQYISATATDLTTSNTSEISMVDSDGDAIADRWERNKTGGFGTIDIDEDGTADFELQGADPTRKDIFVEIDAMVGMAPESSTLNKVEDAFRAAGINLVARLDEPNIANVYPFGASQHAWQEFDKLKYGDPLTRTAGHFGTPTERADTNHSNLLAAKALVYRYSIFGLPQGSWTPGKGCMIPRFPEEDERCRNGEYSAASSRSRR